MKIIKLVFCVPPPAWVSPVQDSSTKTYEQLENTKQNSVKLKTDLSFLQVHIPSHHTPGTVPAESFSLHVTEAASQECAGREQRCKHTFISELLCRNQFCSSHLTRCSWSVKRRARFICTHRAENGFFCMIRTPSRRYFFMFWSVCLLKDWFQDFVEVLRLLMFWLQDLLHRSSSRTLRSNKRMLLEVSKSKTHQLPQNIIDLFI